MASIMLTDVAAISQFDCSETSNMGPRWKRWLRAFELYSGGKGVKNAEQKKSLLLHTAGVHVQDIYFTLPEGEGENVYAKTVDSLTTYFSPEVNVPYERHVFRSMAQQTNETVEQFIMRLKTKADTCEFGNEGSTLEQIRDQVIEKCTSHHLRRKLLEKGKGLTLEQVRDIARAIEMSEQQAMDIEQSPKEVGKSEVNKVSTKSKKSFHKNKNNSEKKLTCYSCGKEGHKSKDSNCAALGKECRYCKGTNHFERCCRKKLRDKNKVRTMNTDQHEHAFIINTTEQNDKSVCVNIIIGGVQSKVMIDSGASCNVTDRNQWEFLKEAGIVCTSKKESKPLYAYGSSKPLPVAGTFQATVKYCDKQTITEFIVIEGQGKTLLGKETAIELGLLHIGPFSSVNNINSDTDKTDFKQSVLNQYPECFTGLGKLKNFQLKIPIDKTVKPTAQLERRIPFSVRDTLEKKITELEKLDIIEKVDGPSTWASPVVCIPKGSNKNDIRLCVDMRVANGAVMRERFQIPTIDDIMQTMNKSTVFSKIDIKWAYHQLELSPESRDITTFVTHKGLYRYKRLIFGISCAPEMYQKVLGSLLQDCEGAKNIMDDIIVFGENESEHDERLHRVISKLRDCGFTLNPEKCSFRMNRVVFMGHVLSPKGIGPTEVKVKAILDAQEPKSASEVKSFLGLVNFSARFIPNLATINEPLRNLTKKNVPFIWGKKEADAFEQLKNCLSSTQCMGYFDKNLLTQIVTDASPVGLGAVLLQKQSDGHSKIISYASRALTDVEKRYSQTEKEALAIVWACERFHMYVYGLDFEILTDHKPLECIYSVRSKPSARIERWVLRLQPYTYRVRYIAGSENIADPLSRLLSKVHEAESSVEFFSENYVNFIAKEATPIAMTTRQIELESENDTELVEIRTRLLDGQWYKTNCKEYLHVKNELCAIGMLVLRGSRIVIPSCLRNRILELAHEGHPGIVVMKQRIRSKVWWPNIDKSIESFCKSCYGCQLVAVQSRPEPMIRTDLPTLPWQHLGIDLLGPLPSGEMLLVVVDYYSRWIEVIVLRSSNSEQITKSLFKIFVTHGLPESIQTDNGPQFISSHFKQFMKENGIKHFHTTPLWPQANGQVERQNRSILKRIRIAHSQQIDWRDDLNTFLLMYRSTPHCVTGESPFKLLHGREMRTKIPSIDTYKSFNYDDIMVRDRDSELKEKGKIYSDRKRLAQESYLKEGDKVLVRQEKGNKLSTPFNPNPFTVIDKKGNCVTVQSEEGVNYKRNVTHLKKFIHKDSLQMESKEVGEASDSDSESKPNASRADEILPPRRSVRLKKQPVKLHDYILNG